MRSYLNGKIEDSVYKTEINGWRVRCAGHMTPSIRRSLTSLVVALSVALIHVATATDVVCGSSQYMANPDDCSSFYECVGGVPVLIPCPIGLHYSKITHICDYPALAQCDPDYVAPTVAPTEEAPTVAPTEEVPDYYCPPTNDAGVVLYPSPWDCSAFYRCNLGRLEKLLCPEGLEYSASERACEYPEIANCDLNNLPSVDPNPVPTVSTPLTPNLDCSASSEDNPILYPSPYSCSDFYKCSEGLPILEHCPPGLDYNAKTSQCDYPQLAGCDSSVSQVTVVPTKSPVTVPTPDSPEGVYCPPDVEGLLVPNPLDCNSYYDCNYGLPQLEKCPLRLILLAPSSKYRCADSAQQRYLNSNFPSHLLMPYLLQICPFDCEYQELHLRRLLS
uniref:Chitin-binding type-2 domain-containing protein n=1 Tax=Timema tahoe TaxID=61484 RepID=A0A7R9FGG2_9NEOP|nr:unnamed protein product [Timema tahoe]